MSLEQWWGVESKENLKKLGEKSTPLPFCVPQISHEVTWDLTQCSVVRSQCLTS
jgi:hypothetical protein